MEKHLVLVGGGHAHMLTLAGLGELTAAGHRVTVIGPSEYHYYSGMGPGMLGGTYSPDEIRFATRQVVEKYGGEFIVAKVARIDPESRTVFLDSGQTAAYDVISFNAGSYVPEAPVVEKGENFFPVKPIERLMEARRRLIEMVGSGPVRVAVVGGGPSAAEISGNILQLAAEAGGQRPTVTIFSASRLMDPFPEAVRLRVKRELQRRGIRIIENDYVAAIQGDQIRLKSGQTHAADFVFLALGVKPSPIFKASGLPTGPDGGLRVNRFLQSTRYPEMFGGGDCIYFQEQPLNRVGVYAVRQNPVLFHNLKAALNGGDLQPFNPGGDYLLIFNLGDRRGVLHKRWLTFGGRPAFIVKDLIDRRFMRKFQAIE
ncbi:MAG: FAD-dependent oxidoreductase [Desulfobacteraceae bacterium]|jgi:NADH dehydrogenase FAD-containing subunit